MLIALKVVVAPTAAFSVVFAVPELTVKPEAPSTAPFTVLLKRIALLVVLTVVSAAKVTGPANVISAGFVEPVVIDPESVVMPVCVALPSTKPVNFPPLPKIESVPFKIAVVMLSVLPMTPTPIVLALLNGAIVKMPPAL